MYFICIFRPFNLALKFASRLGKTVRSALRSVVMRWIYSSSSTPFITRYRTIYSYLGRKLNFKTSQPSPSPSPSHNSPPNPLTLKLYRHKLVFREKLFQSLFRCRKPSSLSEPCVKLNFRSSFFLGLVWFDRYGRHDVWNGWCGGARCQSWMEMRGRGVCGMQGTRLGRRRKGEGKGVGICT